MWKGHASLMPKFRLYLLSLCSLFCLVASSSLAQVTNATLNGIINDPNGAAIVGAHVQVKNVDTNSSQDVETNGTGVYSVGELQPGKYSITVESPGFRKSVQTGVVLTVGQVATLNISMQVGDTKQTVTVSANAELINTTTADISEAINERAIKELPLNGRDPSSLVLLTTGVTNVLNTSGSFLQTSNSFSNESGASSGGGRQGSTYYLLDGAPHMDNYQELAAPFPNADATQEFRVISNNFDAQYGFSPGAVVSIQSKSGSNAFHGGIFEFLRNNDLNAANYFSHQVDPLKRNQFGGYGGGAIIKDKLFFFANWQSTIANTTASTNSTYTPTQAMLNGDFSAVPIALKAPFTTINGKPNQISTSLFSPAAYTIATTALPLGQNAATGLVNYVGPASDSTYNELTGRLDYAISDKQHVFLRSFTQYYKQVGQSLDGNLLAIVPEIPGEYYDEAFGHTWTVNSSTVNNFIVFYSQMDILDQGESLNSSGQPVCMSKYIAVNEIPGQCYIEGFSVNNGFSSNWDEPTGERRSTYGLSDALIKTVGNHTISVGMDLHKQFAQENTDYPTVPIINFTGQYTGFGLADYLLGYVAQYTQGAGEIASVKGWQLGLYAQDQYRIRPNLTFTAGLRWDPNLPPASTGGRGAAFHPGQQSTVFPNAPTGMVFPGDKGVDAALMPTTYTYFEPRIGVSWQPKSMPHTALRGGFGLFTGPLPYSYYNHAADIAPFSPTFILNGTATNRISFDTPWASFNGGDPFPPFASLSYKPPSNAAIQTPVVLGAIFANNFRLGITQSWSLSVEQQLSHDTALHVAYVGSQSYHQSVIIDQNPGVNNIRVSYPNFGLIATDTSMGTSPYHSLQAGVEKQMSHAIQVSSNFTWSKVIDIMSTGNISQFSSTGGGVADPFDMRFNRGISDLNVPLIWISNFVYTSPSLQGWNQLAKQVLGSWELSTIYTLQSGKPFGIVGGDGNNNSGALQYSDRGNVVPGVSPEVHQGSKQDWISHYVNLGAFTTNPAGTFGTSGRNIFKAPPVNTADAAIMKNWRLHERYGVQFRWELFNAFNHTSFGTPNNDPSSSNFGQITAIGPIAPRVMQGGIKVDF
jgi:hypothetical protein